MIPLSHGLGHCRVWNGLTVGENVRHRAVFESKDGCENRCDLLGRSVNHADGENRRTLQWPLDALCLSFIDDRRKEVSNCDGVR
jgi:hypothetical protein